MAAALQHNPYFADADPVVYAFFIQHGRRRKVTSTSEMPAKGLMPYLVLGSAP